MYLRIKQILFATTLRKRVLDGVFWSLTGTACAKFFILISGIVCANILGKEQYGELGIVRSTINMFVTLGSVGLGATATKYISQYRNTNKGLAARVGSLSMVFAVFSGSFITLCVLFFSKLIASYTLNAPYLVNDIRIGALLLFITVMDGAQNGVLIGFENFKAVARNTFIASIFESVLMVLGAYFNGVFGALLGFGIGYMVLYVCNRISIASICKQTNIHIGWRSLQWKDLKLLYTFSLPVALSSFLVMPTYWAVRTLIARYGGFGELGLFEAADQWRVIILFIPGALGNIVLPLLTNVLEEGNPKSFWKLIWFNILVNVTITLLFCIFIYFSGEQLMNLNGRDFADGKVIMLLTFSTVFSSVATVIGNSLTSRDKVWSGFFFNFLWACMFVSFTFMALQRCSGAEGAAWALLISYIIHSLLQLLYLRYSK